MTGDRLATLAGALICVGSGAQPVLNAVQGTMHTQDWVQLGVAVASALFGWFAEFKKKKV